MIGIARRGHIVQANNLAETVIRKFDEKGELIYCTHIILVTDFEILEYIPLWCSSTLRLEPSNNLMVKLCLEGRAERAGYHNECSLSSLLLHCLSPPWALIVLWRIVPGIVCVNNLVSHSHPRVSPSILPKHRTVSNFKDLLCMVLLLTRGPISRMPALLCFEREGEGVLFASQICEAPEAAKGVQGATRLSI